MKIAKITAEVKYIELKRAFKTALRETTHVEFVRLHVENEEGMVGIGEAPATKAITGEDIESILNSVNSVKNSFVGLTCQESLSLLHSACNIGSSAKAMFDMAFISLYVKESKQSFCDYFKTSDKTPFKTDVTISLNPLDVMLEDAKKAFEDDMSILKVKVGSDISHSIDVIKRVSKELPLAQILVDANQAWSLKDSLEFLKAVNGLKIELVEQPVAAHDLNALKIITEMSEIPILADETVFTLEDAKRVVDGKLAHMINIKLMKCGGITKAVEILEYARENKITCMLGSMLEGPYSIDIALHLAMAYRDVIKYVDLDSPLLYKEESKTEDFDYVGCEIIYNKEY